MNWGSILSGLGKAASAVGGFAKKNPELAVGATTALGSAILGGKAGAQQAKADRAQQSLPLLLNPDQQTLAQRGMENETTRQKYGADISTDLAGMEQKNALLQAILGGKLSTGSVSAPSFLAGRTGSVGGFSMDPETLAALRDTMSKGEGRLSQASDMMNRRTDWQSSLLDEAKLEQSRLGQLRDQATTGALQSGVLGEAPDGYEYDTQGNLVKKDSSFWKKWLLPAAGIGAAAYGLDKLGKSGGLPTMSSAAKPPNLGISFLPSGKLNLPSKPLNLGK